MHDLDGSNLPTLLSAAADGEPTVAVVLPSLHAIGATRTCINLKAPVRKQFWYRGKSDGVWYSHHLFRAHGRGRSHRADPCALLEQFSVPLPEDPEALPNMLRGAQRELALDALGIPAPSRARLTPEKLRERLAALQPMPPTAYFTLRRRLAARRGSVLALGHRANLDVNRFRCPSHLALIGCTGPTYDAPFLGAFQPEPDASREWIDVIPAAPPFKYCRHMGSGLAEAPSKRIPGVAVLLSELHANINVGHAVKDLVFLAHVLVEQRAAVGTNRSFTISAVIVDDLATATGNLSHGQQGFHYRKASIEALVSGAEPPIRIVYLQQGALPHREDFGREPEWRGASSVCFDVALQKGFAYAGDWRGAALFREKVYARCGIRAEEEPDSVLIVVHGLASSGQTTRRWHDQKALVDSVRAHRFRAPGCNGAGAGTNLSIEDGSAAGCRPLRVLVRAMGGLSFCEQAAIYARAKVVMSHHGASLANGYFLRAGSVFVEMNRQWRATDPAAPGTQFAHTFDGAGYGGLFLSSGVAYIGARVTYGVWARASGRNDGHPDPTAGTVHWQLHERVPYDFNSPTMAIGINASRWAEVLDELHEIISPGSRHPMDLQDRQQSAALSKPPSPPLPASVPMMRDVAAAAKRRKAPPKIRHVVESIRASSDTSLSRSSPRAGPASSSSWLKEHKVAVLLVDWWPLAFGLAAMTVCACWICWRFAHGADVRSADRRDQQPPRVASPSVCTTYK